VAELDVPNPSSSVADGDNVADVGEDREGDLPTGIGTVFFFTVLTVAHYDGLLFLPNLELGTTFF